MKRLNTIGLLTVLSLLSAAPAFARDSMHLVCAGYMKKTKNIDPDNYGISVIFDESRFGADSRKEVLSSVFAGDFFQGIKTESNWGDKQDIVIASKDDAMKVFFNGTYQVVSSNKNASYQLKLEGKINLLADGSNGDKISTILECVDISN